MEVEALGGSHLKAEGGIGPRLSAARDGSPVGDRALKLDLRGAVEDVPVEGPNLGEATIRDDAQLPAGARRSERGGAVLAGHLAQWRLRPRAAESGLHQVELKRLCGLAIGVQHLDEEGRVHACPTGVRALRGGHAHLFFCDRRLQQNNRVQVDGGVGLELDHLGPADLAPAVVLNGDDLPSASRADVAQLECARARIRRLERTEEIESLQIALDGLETRASLELVHEARGERGHKRNEERLSRALWVVDRTADGNGGVEHDVGVSRGGASAERQLFPSGTHARCAHEDRLDLDGLRLPGRCDGQASVGTALFGESVATIVVPTLGEGATDGLAVFVNDGELDDAGLDGWRIDVRSDGRGHRRLVDRESRAFAHGGGSADRHLARLRRADHV